MKQYFTERAWHYHPLALLLADRLLALGANPNQARISDGMTPLHW